MGDKNHAWEGCFLNHSRFRFFFFPDLLLIPSFLQPLPFSFLGAIQNSDTLCGWVLVTLAECQQKAENSPPFRLVMEGDDVHGPQPSLWTCDVPPWSGPLTSWDCGRSQLSTASLSDHGKKWASWTCVTPRGSSLSCGLLWMLSTLGQEKLGRAQWRSPRGRYWLSCQRIKGNSRL